MNRFLLIFVVIASSASSLMADQQWGNLSGRFVLDGDLPTIEEPTVTVDKHFFKDPIIDESLIVDAENRGIANVVVYLKPAKSSEVLVHPSYKKSANDKVELEMTNGRFEPHILLLRTTQTMVQVNRQNVGYSPNIVFLRNEPM